MIYHVIFPLTIKGFGMVSCPSNQCDPLEDFPCAKVIPPQWDRFFSGSKDFSLIEWSVSTTNQHSRALHDQRSASPSHNANDVFLLIWDWE
jgi:hypothetical protein